MGRADKMVVSMLTVAALLDYLETLVSDDPDVGRMPVLLVRDDFGDRTADVAEHHPATIGFYNRTDSRVLLVEEGADRCVVIWPKV